MELPRVMSDLQMHAHTVHTPVPQRNVSRELAWRVDKWAGTKLQSGVSLPYAVCFCITISEAGYFVQKKETQVLKTQGRGVGIHLASGGRTVGRRKITLSEGRGLDPFYSNLHVG